MALSTIHSRPNAPIRQKGTVVITMIENLGDSNWHAITTNTRKIAIAMALPRLVNSFCMDFCMLFMAMETPWLSCGVTTSV